MGRPLKHRPLPSRYEILRLGPRAKHTRQQIIARYARLLNGIPLRCMAKRDADDAHIQEKIIYDSLERATACARELRQTGMDKQYAYLCPRSRHGHAHLTRKSPHRVVPS